MTKKRSLKFTFKTLADPDPESNFCNFEKKIKKPGYYNRMTPVKTRVLLAKVYRMCQMCTL
jgi:hypothetical protein